MTTRDITRDVTRDMAPGRGTRGTRGPIGHTDVPRSDVTWDTTRDVTRDNPLDEGAALSGPPAARLACGPRPSTAGPYRARIAAALRRHVGGEDRTQGRLFDTGGLETGVGPSRTPWQKMEAKS